MDGIILINKEEGISSFKVVERVKKKLGLKKIGHTGTLDPFATGLLIGCVNKATKISSIFTALDKTYEATIVFGEERETDDITSKVINKSENIPSITDIEKIIPRFIGEIEQAPPKYSAIRINGQRAYELARKGKEFEIRPRKVHLYSLKIISYKKPELVITIRCSSGFYVRSLARDLGRSLNSYAYLSSLKLTKVGEFSIEESKFIKDIDIKDIIPIKDAIKFLPEKLFNEEEYNQFKEKGHINLEESKNFYKIFFKDVLIGITDKTGKIIYRSPL